MRFRKRPYRAAFGEVSTALIAYQKLALTEKEQAGSVAAYQEAVRLANIRYVAGLANYVEVLDAEEIDEKAMMTPGDVPDGEARPLHPQLAEKPLANVNFRQVIHAPASGLKRPRTVKWPRHPTGCS